MAFNIMLNTHWNTFQLLTLVEPRVGCKDETLREHQAEKRIKEKTQIKLRYTIQRVQKRPVQGSLSPISLFLKAWTPG